MMMIIKYQFPMGKVKRKKQFNCNDNSLVSIPYGKGKARTNKLSGMINKYQFPMGKVKCVTYVYCLLQTRINSLWER